MLVLRHFALGQDWLNQCYELAGFCLFSSTLLVAKKIRVRGNKNAIPYLAL